MKMKLKTEIEIEFGQTKRSYCQLPAGLEFEGEAKEDGFFYFDCPPHGLARLSTKFFDNEEENKGTEGAET